MTPPPGRFWFGAPTKGDIILFRVALTVAIAGSILMATLMVRRLQTRAVVARLPTLEELAADTSNPTRLSRAGSGDDSKHSANPAADTAYRVGIRELVVGRHDSAARALDRALLLDSTLAGAALRRSLVASWEGEVKVALDQAARAQRFATSLTPHERRILDAHLTWMSGDIPHADSAWRVALSIERGDPVAWYGAAFVHLHDGGWIDTSLIARGSPAMRGLRRIPARRLSFLDAALPLRQLLALAPTHQRARLQLAKIAAATGNMKFVDAEAWNVERAGVEPSVRLAMRALFADMRGDSSLWHVVKASSVLLPAHDLFAAARILAEGSGLRSRIALFHAAELLEPLTRAPNDSATIARAYVWRALLRDASGRAGSALDELALGAAYDPSVALPTAAYVAWLDPSTPDSALTRVRNALRAWHPATRSSAGRDEFHPHAGLEPYARAYALGLVSTALQDTTTVLDAARTIDSLGPIPNEPRVAEAMATALRAELRLSVGDLQGAIALSPGLHAALRPLARNESPLLAQLHARYRYGFLEQRAWRNNNARATYVSFFTPTIPELTLYRQVVKRFASTP